MAQQSIEILRNYMTCEDPAVKNKYYNLLDSFWHKSKGELLSKIIEDENGVEFIFTNNKKVTIPKPEALGSVEISFVNGLQDALDKKVNQKLGKGLSTNDFTNTLLQKLNGLENYTLPDSFPISQIENLQTTLDTFQPKEDGKGLSANNLTNELLQKLNDYESVIDNITTAVAEPPNYKSPTVGLSNVTQTVEKGTDLSDLTLNISFVKNDAGDIETYSLEKDGAEISTSQNNSESLTNITNEIEYQGFVNYEAGDCKENNLGVEDCTGRIEAGKKGSTIRKITPKLHIWYGAVDNIPTQSNTVRAIGNDVWNDASGFNLSTGTTKTKFVVAVPKTKTTAASLDAQDITNNVSLVYEFQSEVDVNLPTGTATYRVYALEVGNAYPKNAQHKIKL